jgi:NTE family protein
MFQYFLTFIQQLLLQKKATSLITNKLLFAVALSFFLLNPTVHFSQEKKPKVVLVLSGGGAKGIAHIPLLQALDSLGIVPDLVLGTSMGSIVGGLYAAGYSGDSIANIANNANWDELLGGDISLSEVSVEEKSEFKKYLIDLNFENNKPKVSSSILNDQVLREFLSKVTFPVFDVNNFDNLPIPYRAMATDIVNGKEVILKEGSLALAMRASMSIPSVFKPVEYNNTLLVDGGVLNNFPTDIAVEMGADIIIGSDVGGGMAPIEDLNNLVTILFQTGMLSSNLKNPERQKNCTILLDHYPYLSYSTGDFAKSKEIYEEGKIATNINMEALVALAQQLKNFPKKSHELPYKDPTFTLDTISYTGISKANIDLVKARANIKINTKYSVQDIVDGINRAMGTNLFNQITTNYINDNGKTGIQINGFEISKHQLQGSIHYDTYRGVGLIVNNTLRNVLGDASRLIVTIDIAEQPRFRVGYQKIFGNDKSFWWKSELYGAYLKQQIFINGENVDDMKEDDYHLDNQINKNFNSLKSFAGFGVIYKNTKLKPKKNPDYINNVYNLNDYTFKNLELYLHYNINSLNQSFYATKGTYLNANIGRSFINAIDLKYIDNLLPEVDGHTNNYTKLAVNYESRHFLSDKVTGIIGATGSFIFEDKISGDEYSFSDYGYAGKYSIGGNLLIPKKGSYMFPGLYEGELNASQFLKLNLGVQFSPLNKIYITPNFNIATVGFGEFNEYFEDILNPKGNWEDSIETSLLMSAGASLSYNSILGPINFDMSWVNDIDKIRLFFSLGFTFHPSNR